MRFAVWAFLLPFGLSLLVAMIAGKAINTDPVMAIEILLTFWWLFGFVVWFVRLFWRRRQTVIIIDRRQ